MVLHCPSIAAPVRLAHREFASHGGSRGIHAPEKAAGKAALAAGLPRPTQVVKRGQYHSYPENSEKPLQPRVSPRQKVASALRGINWQERKIETAHSAFGLPCSHNSRRERGYSEKHSTTSQLSQTGQEIQEAKIPLNVTQRSTQLISSTFQLEGQ